MENSDAKRVVVREIAEALGNERAVIATEQLMLQRMQDPQVRDRLREILVQDRDHLQNLEQALQQMGGGQEAQRWAERAEHAVELTQEDLGDEMAMVQVAVLGKHRAIDGAELLGEVCGEMGQSQFCDRLKKGINDDENHLGFYKRMAQVLIKEYAGRGSSLQPFTIRAQGEE